MQAFILYSVPEKSCWKTLFKCHFSSRVRICDVLKLFIPIYFWRVDHDKGTQGKIWWIWWMFQESCLYLGQKHLFIENYVETLSTESLVLYHKSPFGTCGGRSGTGLGFIPVILHSLVSVIPPVLHTNMHLASADPVWCEQLAASLVKTRKIGKGMISLCCQMGCYPAVLYSKHFKTSSFARLFGRNKAVSDTSFVIKKTNHWHLISLIFTPFL